MALLRDLADSEGVHVYPSEPEDSITPLPNNRFFATMLETAKMHLGPSTRLAASINGQTGLWISFSVDEAGEDVYWLMLPGERAVAVMLLVHHEGKGLCGVYTRDIAQTKQQQVMQRAKREGHPLQCIVEEV